jgi:hypothetical protein
LSEPHDFRINVPVVIPAVIPPEEAANMSVLERLKMTAHRRNALVIPPPKSRIEHSPKAYSWKNDANHAKNQVHVVEAEKDTYDRILPQ